MSGPTWMHFTDADAVVVEDRAQAESGSRRYRRDKPEGFWISDESAETSWSGWASGEDYSIGRNAFEIKLAPDATVLSLTSEAAVVEFHRKFSTDRWSINWPTVAAVWQGITITPYQWSLRLASGVAWYYTWDCASGCIWDASAIAEVVPVAERVSS